MNLMLQIRSKQIKIAIWLLVLVGFILPNISTAQQGWEKIFGTIYSEAVGIIEGHDGNIIVAGEDAGGLGSPIPNVLQVYFVKLNQYGDRIWQRTFEGQGGGAEIYKSPDGTYIGKRKQILNINGLDQSKAILFKLDENGNTLWEYVVQPDEDDQSNARNIIVNEAGEILFLTHLSNSIEEVKIVRLGPDGNLISSIDFPFIYLEENLVSKPGGGFYKFSTLEFDYLEIFEYNDAASLIGYQSYPNLTDRFEVPHILDDGDIVLFQTVLFDRFQLRIDVQTNSVSSKVVLTEGYGATKSLLLEDGFITSGLHWENGSNIWAGMMTKTDLDGNVEWLKTYDHLPGTQFLYCAYPMSNGDFVAAGYISSFTSGTNESWVIRTNEFGEIYANSIAGIVAIDSVENCQFDFDETPLEDWVVSAEKGDQTLVALTNATGNYVLPLDTGSYQLNVYPPNNLWMPCVNDVFIELPNINIDTFLNFPIGINALCPSLSISHAISNLRPCFERSSYINYCNYGTETAYNAYIDISYDSLITPVSSSMLFDTLPGNIYRFDLGNIAPLECGSFSVSLFLDCEAPVGASYCIEAHAYPDSICLPDSSGWNGAFLEASGFCDEDNDQVYFRIQNTGTADMPDYSNYIIVEDILFLELDSVDLNEGDFIDLPFPANGSTYTLIAEQVAGVPGFSSPIAIVEGCGENDNGGFSIGFSNQFPLNDENPFLDEDCVVAVSSFDPNDKQGFPLGYDEEHYISPNTPIEYLIRFQNTGTDTAFTVVVRDTLDTNFDLASFSSGTSSHGYDVEFEGLGILKFTFQNINLPDSIVDEPGSNGFVEFKIAPKADTPLETIVRNKAGIYFDFNEPIITNETFHTVGEIVINIESSVVEHPEIENIEAIIQPNPLHDQTSIYFKNYNTGEYILEIFNLQGQMLRREKHAENPVILKRNQLTSGSYFLRITNRDGLNYTGKLLIH